MGRGNVCVFGEYEGLYYVDFDNFSCYREDENGNQILDRYGSPIHIYWLENLDLEMAIREFTASFTQRFKSFQKCEKWLSNSRHALLGNNLFYIATEDNQWSEAFLLIQKEQDYYSDGRMESLQKGHYLNYLHGMRNCLFEQFEELGIYEGPWTSGRIRKAAAEKGKLQIGATERFCK